MLTGRIADRQVYNSDNLVRKQSKLIVDLISDDNRLSDERAKAKQIKERMAQVLGSGAHYGSYSSNTSPLPENKSN